jgi:uncharacterized repeat protein (TIGR01451 family)
VNVAEVTESDQYDPDSTPDNDDGDQSEDDEDNEDVTPQQADLELVKTVNDNTPNVGDIVTFTIEVTNQGPSDATSVAFEDVVPNGYSGISNISNGGSLSGNVITWSGFDIAVGSSVTVTFDATVEAPGAGVDYVNVAEVTESDQYDPDSTPDNDDGDQSEDDEDNEDVTPQQADLELVKTVNDNTPNVGDIVTFTIEVTNQGPSDATSVAFEDVVPNGYSGISNISNGGSLSGNVITWSGFDIAVGSSVTVTFDATVEAPGAGVDYVNVAEVTESDQYDPDSTPDNDDGDQSEDDEDNEDVTPQQADLELVKTVNDNTPNVGDVVTFTIEVTNQGPSDATSVAFEDVVPNGYSAIGNISNGGTLSANVITWSGFDIAVGSSVTVTFDATVEAPGAGVDYVNVAEVTESDQYDPDSTPDNDDGDQSEDDEDNEDVTPQQADLELVKTVNDNTPNVGDVVTFTIEVTNQGPSDATSVAFEDVVPNGYSGISNISNGGSLSGNVITWSGFDITVGSSVTVTFDATVEAPGAGVDYVNVAEVTESDQYDPDSTPDNDDGDQSEDDEDNEDVTPQQADLELVKTVNDNTPNVGDVVTFTIEVTNQGPSDATSVAFEDVVPNGYSAIGNISNGGTLSGNVITWSGFDIAVGSSVTVTFDATVEAPGAGVDYVNVAEVTESDQYDPDSTPDNDDGDQSEDDEDNEDVTPQQADLELVKTVNDNTPNVGDVVTFTIEVTNQGPSDATSVAFEDVVPNGYSGISNISNGGSLSGNVITWSGFDIAVGSSVTVTFDATVEAPGAGVDYVNVAEVTESDQYDPDSTPDNDDGDQSEDDEDNEDVTPQQADLELVKTVNDNTPNVGDVVTFTIEVTNQGPSDATSVAFEDVVPNGYSAIGNISNGGTLSGNVITWSGFDITVGSSVTVTFDATVEAPGAGVDYVNVAEVTESDQYDPDSTPDNDDGDQSEDDEDNEDVTPQQADLELVKTVNDNTPNVGDIVTFTIEVTNQGPSDATSVAFEDVVPNGYSGISNISNGGSLSGNVITWSGFDIAVGSSVTVTFDATVEAPGAGVDYVNVAEVTESDQYDPDSTPDNDDGDQSEDDEDNEDVTPQQADLELVKTVNDNTPNVGDVVSFTIEVTNQGPSDATSVAFEDVVPNGYSAIGNISNGGTLSGNVITWSGFDIAVGSSVTVTFDATVEAPGAGVDYVNVAEVTESDQYDPDSTPDNDDGDQSEDDEDNEDVTPQQADLELVKTVNDNTPNVGDVVTFTIEVTNQGPSDATSVAFEDVVPNGYSAIGNISNGGTLSGNVIAWSGFDIAVGSSVTVTFDATVEAPGAGVDYVNVAEVTESDQYDPDSTPDNDDGDQSEDDEDNEDVTPQQADLELVKTVNDNTPNVGDIVTFTIEVTNQGPSDATSVAFEDVVPNGYSAIGNISNGGTLSGNVITWSGFNIAVGSSVTVTFDATVEAPGAGVDYVNVAEVTESDQYDPDSTPDNDDGDQSEDDEDNEDVTPQQADLELVKTVNDNTPNVGDVVTFTIEVTNQGPSDATSVAFEDVVPNGYSAIGNISNGGTLSGNVITWSGFDITVGSSVTVTFDATVEAPGAGVDYVNVAEVTESDQYDPDSTPDNDDGDQSEDDEDNEDVTPQQADLELVKTVNDNTPNVGDVVTFTIEVTNQGPSDATGVAFVDEVPNGYSGISNISNGGTLDGDSIIWSGFDILVGESVSVSFDVTVEAPDAGVDYLNVAQITESDQHDPDSTPDNDDGDQSEDDEDNEDVTPQQADLQLVKRVSNASPNVGEVVEFTIRIDNDGPNNATGIVVVDPIPNGYANISSVSNMGIYLNDTITWSGLSIPNGGSLVLSFEAEVLEPGAGVDYENVVEINAVDQYDPDSTPDNGADTNGNGLIGSADDDSSRDVQDEDDGDDAIVEPQQADLELIKTVDNNMPDVGTTVTFTIEVLNNGPSDATNVAVEDVIPNGYTSASNISDGGTLTGNIITWTGLDIAVGTSVFLTFDVIVEPTGDYLNTAEVTDSDQYDPDSTPDNDDGDQSEDDEDNEEVDPNPVIDLELDKSVDDQMPDEGSDITFTLSLTNQGPSDATGVVVTDQLPAGFTFVSTTGSYNSATGEWTVGNLAVGQTVTLDITVTVNEDGPYVNLAEVTAANEDDIDSTPNNGVDTDGDGEVDDDPEDEDDGDGVTVEPVEMTASIDIEKSTNGQDADLAPGAILLTNPVSPATVTWTYTVTNTGTLDLINVEVTDDEEGVVGTIPFLAAGATETLTLTGTAQLGMYGNLGTADGQPIGGNGNPFGDPVTDSDPSNYTGVFINVEKQADQTEVCEGEEVNYTLITRMLGGAPGVQIRNISVVDNNLPGETLTNTHPFFIASSDVGGDAMIDFVDNNNDGISDEEFMWEYALTLTQTTTNIANDMGDVWFVDQSGNEFFIGTVGNSDQVTVDVISPEVSVDVTPATQDVIYGDDATFTITVTNEGDVPLENVVVTDSEGNADCEMTITSLAVGASESFTCTLPNITENTTIDFDVTAGGLGSAGSVLCSVDAEASASVTVIPLIDLELTKTVTPEVQNVGENVTFTVSVINQGPAPATGVVVADQLPDGFTYVSSTGGYNETTGEWMIGDLAIGEEVSITITATVNASGDYKNVAEVSEADQDDVDSTPNNDDGDQSEDDEDSAEVTPVPVIDLELTKQVDDQFPYVGDNVTFTITVFNQGPSDATGVIVEDQLPSGFDFISASSGAYSNTTGEWNIGDLAAGASATLTITVEVLGNTDWCNEAQVIAANEDDIDSTPGNGVDTDGDGIIQNDAGDEDDGDGRCVAPVPQVDISLVKTVDPQIAQVGDQVTFTITVKNDGPNDATGVVVEDQLPAGFTLVSASADYNPATGLWNVGALQSGFSESIMILATVNENGSHVNIAEVVATDQEDVDSTPDNGADTNGTGGIGSEDPDNSQDPDDEDDGDDAEVTIDVVVDLELDKSVAPASVMVGEQVTFTIEVTNQGPSTATGVTVEDFLETGFTYVGTNGNYNPATGVWNIGTVSAGETVSLEIYATVNEDGTYTNFAEVCTANEDDADSTPCNGDEGEDDDDEVEVNVECELMIDLFDIVCDDNGTPSDDSDDTYTFTINVTGSGINDSWEANIAGTTTTGAYGEDVSFGPYSIAQVGDITFQVVDADNPDCNDFVVVEAPETCSDECLIVADYANVICDDNGTPADPTDDLFFFDLLVTESFNAGSGWTASVNGTVIVPFAGYISQVQGQGLGGFPIAGSATYPVVNGFMEVLVTDFNDPDCSTTVLVPVPETCSDECGILFTNVSAECDPNGTLSDPSDDLFDVTLTVTGNNTGNSGWVIPATGQTGAYGSSVTVTGFAIANGAATIVFEDVEDPTCNGSVTVDAPDTCSDQCDITAQAINILCDDNGTPANPNDDTYTFDVVVTGLNTGSNGWTDGTNNGSYGIAEGYGPFSISDNPVITLNIQDVDDPACTDQLVVNAPAPCSDQCLITAVQTNLYCDDNNTPSDASDDVYFIDVVVTGNVNASTSWTATGNIGSGPASGAYNTNDPYTFGPYTLGMNVQINFTDAQNPSCMDGLSVQIPTEGCSDACNLAISNVSTLCDDNGTPFDEADDQWYIVLELNGMNTSGCWMDSEGNTGNNIPGLISYGPYPVSQEMVMITIMDCNDPECTATAMAFSPGPCSDACELDVDILDVSCLDNGTPNNPDDDQFEALVNVTPMGTYSGLGWRWKVLPNGAYSTPQAYSTPITLGTFDVSGGNVMIRISDAGNTGCFQDITIEAPEPCSDACELMAEFINQVCDDNGTPSDPSDDTYSFELLVTNPVSTGDTWFATVQNLNNTTITGTYGLPYLIENIPATEATVLLNIMDAHDPLCMIDELVVPATGPCSDGCALTVDVNQSDCMDNGTSTDPSDDTYSVEVLITNTNAPGTGWTATINGTAYSGDYGIAITIDGIPANDPTVITDVQDNVDAGCAADAVTVPATGTCSSDLPCDISAEVVDMSITCDDGGTLGDEDDDTFTLEVIVTNLGIGDNWQAVDGTYGVTNTGTYGTPQLLGPYPAADYGDIITITITDADDPSCQATLTVEIPQCNDCTITGNMSNVQCFDQGTADPNDDTFTFDLFITGENVGTTWTSTDSTVTNGVFGQTYTFGPYNIMSYQSTGQDVVFNISPDANDNCELTVLADPPQPCSVLDCEISATITNIVCNDNGTPTNPDDDTYTFDAVVNPGLASGAFALAYINGAQVPVVAMYNTTMTYGPFLISDGDVSVTWEDGVDPSCSITETITAPAPCSNEVEDCEISATAEVTDCIANGPGTADDEVYITITVTNISGAGTNWSANNGAFTGEYGVPETFGPFPVGVDQTFDIENIGAATCSTSVTVDVPDQCAQTVDCEISANAFNVLCDDNGTPDPDDDTFSFQLLVLDIAGNAGPTWEFDLAGVTVDGIFGLPTQPLVFSVEEVFGNGGSGDLSILIYDANNVDCVTALSIVVPIVPEIECPDDTDTATLTQEVQSIFGQLNANDPVLDSLCWANGEANGDRYYDSLTVTPDATDVYTFVLLSDMSAGNLNEGWGAIFDGAYDGLMPCCNIIDTTHAPGTAGAVTLETPMLDFANWNFGGFAPVGSMTTQLLAGQPYTLLTTSLQTGVSGNYRWAVFSQNGGALLDIFQIPFQSESGPVLYDLLCNDYESIVDDMLSLAYTGNATITESCGIDSFFFNDQLMLQGDCEATIINRTFTVTDIQGNAFSCNQEITVNVPELEDVKMPPLTARFDCGEFFVEDANGNPHPDVTGYPYVLTAFGVNTLDEAYCNLSANYEDERDDLCAAGYTLNRTWTIVDDCNSGEVRTFVQTIKVGDFEAPVVSCPTSNHYCPIIEEDIMLFSTDPFDCTATLEVPMPEVSDVCSDEWEVITEIVQYTQVNGQQVETVLQTILPGEPRLITGLEIGDYVFRYIVTDECGNTAIQECLFRIADLSEPVAICSNGFNISVGGFGLARLYSHQVDQGSYDNCGIDSILVRRVYTSDPDDCTPLGTPIYSEWGPYVDFTCCDAGSFVTVELRVVDVNGNVNMCWMDVLVEDKTLPYCYGLEDVQAECGSLPIDFDPFNLAQLDSLFGEAYVYDNCSAETVQLDPIVELSDCGNGTIIRRFLAVDLVGNVSQDTFLQVVTLGGNGGYDIQFPRDTTMYCGDNLQDTMTLVYYSGCDSITVSYTDTLVQSTGSECYQVLRTYDVINHCQYDGISDPVVIGRNEDCDSIAGDEDVWVLYRLDTTFIDADSLAYNLFPLAGTKDTICDGNTNPDGYWRTSLANGYWQYTQVISVYDTITPVISFEVPDAFCNYEEPGMDCEGPISYAFSVADDCLPDSSWMVDTLSFRVLLDSAADGTINADVTDFVSISGSYPDYVISGDFPLGVHALQLEVSDACGNTAIDSLPFEVIDCFVAAANAYDGLVVELQPLSTPTDMDGDGDLEYAAFEVMVDYLLEGAQEVDCNGPVSFSINRKGEDPDIDRQSLILSCEDTSRLDVEVWAWDDAFNPYAVQPDGTVGGRNRAMVEATITIQNMSGTCDPGLIQPGDEPNRSASVIVPELHQNRPNPFSDYTTISFWLPEAGEAQLMIYDLAGKQIKLIEGRYNAGTHQVEILRSDLPSYGIFFYSLRTGKFFETKQMIMIE